MKTRKAASRKQKTRKVRKTRKQRGGDPLGEVEYASLPEKKTLNEYKSTSPEEKHYYTTEPYFQRINKKDGNAKKLAANKAKAAANAAETKRIENEIAQRKEHLKQKELADNWNEEIKEEINQEEFYRLPLYIKSAYQQNTNNPQKYKLKIIINENTMDYFLPQKVRNLYDGNRQRVAIQEWETEYILKSSLPPPKKGLLSRLFSRNPK